MSLTEELLNQADHLLSIRASGGAPFRDADVRRAVSNAYYALFHLLVSDATALLCPAGPPVLAARLCRAFAHKEMREVCRQVAKRRSSAMTKSLQGLFTGLVAEELAAVANTFVNLQLDRHAADYDTVTPFKAGSDAQNAVYKARQAVAAWKTIRDTDNARVFLTALLLAGRWSRD